MKRIRTGLLDLMWISICAFLQAGVLAGANDGLIYRYAYSADGFNQDRDDVAGSAMVVALFDRIGWGDRLVHFHFNTNFGGQPTHAQEHRKSVLWTAKLFGMIEEVDGDDGYFDVSRSPEEKAAAIEHLAEEIRSSKLSKPLMIFCGGGVQVPYAALKLAMQKGILVEDLQAVTFVSHSVANERTRRKGHPEYGVNWSDLVKLTPYPTFIDHTSPLVNARKNNAVIRGDQNVTAWNTSPRKKMQGVAHWQWLAEYGGHVEVLGFSGTKGRWLLTRLKAAGAPEIGHNGNAEADASDAGMVFGQLPGGTTDADMNDIRVFFLGAASSSSHASQKSRLIVMADMGNEPDEEQQMAHLLMYANRVDIEGLIACSGKYLHADRTDGRVNVHPELFHKLVDGYEHVVENLKQHESGWPTPATLRSVIKAGTPEYGIKAVKPGRSNEASRLIETAILKDDPRKLYIVGNAGTNTLAQALVDLDQTRSQEEMDALCSRIIVFENGAQDNSGAWIAGHYPRIAWHRSNHQTYAYGGPGKAEGPYTWEPYVRDPDGQNDWAKENIMNDHGALGALFPPRFMKRLHFIEGGGTIPWMGLVNHGLSDSENLWWGGWSGRFSRERHLDILSRHADIRKDETAYGEFWMFEADSEKDTWTDPVHGETFTSHFVPVWRFRRAMFNDFRARMDWCVKPYTQANHNPIAAFNGDTSDSIVLISTQAGRTLTLDASASKDPDNDGLDISWWIYREAGTHDKEILVPNSKSPVTSLRIPQDAAGTEIHIILEVRDDNDIVPLYDYRRVVVRVEPREVS